MKLGLKKDFYGTVVVGYGSILLNMIAQVVLIPLYIKGLGTTGYGVFLLIFSFINYVDIGVGLFSGGILRIMGENYARGDNYGIRNAYTISKSIICIYGVIAALLFYLYAMFIKRGEYFDDNSYEAMKIVFSAMLFIFAKYDLSVEYQALMGTQRQTLSNTFQMMAQIIYLVFAIPYLSQGGDKVSQLFVYNLIGLFVIRVCIFIYHRIKKDAVQLTLYNPEMKIVRTRLIGKMGISYALYGILIITFQADTLVLGTLTTAEALTMYAMTWKVAEAARQVLWKIPESMQPYIIEQDAKNNKKELQEQYKKIYYITFGLSVLAGLVYGLLGKTIIKLWLGSTYIEITDLRIWLTAFVILLNGIERTPAIYAFSMVRLKALNKLAAIEVIAKTVLMIALFPFLDILAPLVAMIIVHVCGVAIAYWKLGKEVVYGE